MLEKEFIILYIDFVMIVFLGINYLLPTVDYLANYFEQKEKEKLKKEMNTQNYGDEKFDEIRLPILNQNYPSTSKNNKDKPWVGKAIKVLLITTIFGWGLYFLLMYYVPNLIKGFFYLSFIIYKFYKFFKKRLK